MEQLKASVSVRAMLFALSIVTFGTPAWADAAADIRALEDRFVAAFKAKDVDAIMKVYAPDQTLVVFDVVPPRQYVGAAAYRKDWQTFLGSFEGPITVELTDGCRPQPRLQPQHSAGDRHGQARQEARSHRARYRCIQEDPGWVARHP